MENLIKDQAESQSSSNKKIKIPYGSFEVHDFHISQTIGIDDKEKKLFGDQSQPNENKGQLPCHVVKSLLPSAAFILGIRMSDSDSQNVSGRDYDEGDEAVSESFSPSTEGSTFNQIDEVEHVSPNAEENEGPL
nr:B3 domain-containing protein Os01g0723500-like [Ipomoea trifida]